MAQDLRVELHFYGRGLAELGIVWYATPQIPMNNPELLFFCLFTMKLLTNKKITPAAFSRIKQRLALGAELEKVFTSAEDRPFDRILELREYTIVTKSVIRSQILFRGGDKFSFMLGMSGFGFLGNRRHFDRGAEGAVFGLMENLYIMMQEDKTAQSRLFEAAERLGNASFTVSGGLNSIDMAKKIYGELTLR